MKNSFEWCHWTSQYNWILSKRKWRMMVGLLYFQLSIQFNVANIPLHRNFTPDFNSNLFAERKNFKNIIYFSSSKSFVNRRFSWKEVVILPLSFYCTFLLNLFRPFDYSFWSFPPSIWSLFFVLYSTRFDKHLSVTKSTNNRIVKRRGRMRGKGRMGWWQGEKYESLTMPFLLLLCAIVWCERGINPRMAPLIRGRKRGKRQRKRGTIQSIDPTRSHLQSSLRMDHKQRRNGWSKEWIWHWKDMHCEWEDVYFLITTLHKIEYCPSKQIHESRETHFRSVGPRL